MKLELPAKLVSVYSSDFDDDGGSDTVRAIIDFKNLPACGLNVMATFLKSQLPDKPPENQKVNKNQQDMMYG